VVDINVDPQQVVPNEVRARLRCDGRDHRRDGARRAVDAVFAVATIGLRAGLAVIGISVSVAVIFGLAGLRRINATVLAPPGLDLLRLVEILAPLPEPILERLARALVQAQTSSGEVVIRQGDSGDRVYFIESGSVEIARRPPRRISGRARSSARSLLRAVPRTARDGDERLRYSRRSSAMSSSGRHWAARGTRDRREHGLETPRDALAATPAGQLVASRLVTCPGKRTPIAASTITNAPTAMTTSPIEKTFASGIQSGAAQRSTSSPRCGSVMAVLFA
jgi:hypothetical protein